jgi:UDP-perosamine 4-acetyltransferase
MTTPGAILLGSGGHARVVRHLARACGMRVDALCDPGLMQEGLSTWEGLTFLGGDEGLEGEDRANPLLNGVGILPGNQARARLQDKLTAAGWGFPALTHPAAWVADNVDMDAGVQIMAGAVVQPGCQIGEGTILNTKASLDHDSRTGRFCHIAPGATLCGGVTLGDHVFVGAGATIVQGITIGQGAVIAAGAVIVQDVAKGETAFGRYGARTKL